jgi:hypothetical protein
MGDDSTRPAKHRHAASSFLLLGVGEVGLLGFDGLCMGGCLAQ